jgi:glutamate/aspartate transport system substrate-binding protein
MSWFADAGRTAYRSLAAAILCVSCTEAPAIELRTAAQDSSPKYYLENGKMKGLCIDIMRAIEVTDPELKFSGQESFYPTLRIEESLSHGEIDVFCGMIRTPGRESKLTFIDVPLYHTITRLAVNSSDQVEIASLGDVRKLGKNGVILVVHGTAHAEFLAQQGGLLIDDGARTTAHNIRKLLAGRGRFICQTDLALADELKRRGLANKVRILPLVVKSEAQYLAVSSAVPPDVVFRLRKALKKLQETGELTRLRMYYLRLD